MLTLNTSVRSFLCITLAALIAVPPGVCRQSARAGESASAPRLIGVANEQQLLQAAEAVAGGNTEPELKRIVRQNNDAINRLATRGEISNATYQKVQSDFDAFNGEVTRQVAADAGLEYGKQAPPIAPDSAEAQRLLAQMAERQAVLDQAEAERRAYLKAEREAQLQARQEYEQMLEDYNRKMEQITDYQQRLAEYNKKMAAWDDYQRKLENFRSQADAWNDYRRQLADYNNRVAQYNDYRQKLADYNHRVAAWNDYQRRVAEQRRHQQQLAAQVAAQQAQRAARHFGPSVSGPIVRGPVVRGPAVSGAGGGQKRTAVISDKPL